MIRSRDILDDYAGGRFLRRWSIVDGYARCVEDAYAVAATDPAVLDAQRAINADVRAAIAAVERYEDALALAGQAEPPPADPTHADWLAAAAAVAAADPDTLALHRVRSGQTTG